MEKRLDSQSPADKLDDEQIVVLKKDLIHVAYQCRARGMTETASQLEAMIARCVVQSAAVAPDATVVSEGMDHRAMIDRITPCPVGTKLYKTPQSASERIPERETRVQLRERFEAWFKMTQPLWSDGKDTTLKHQLWTAWQVAHLG